MQRGRRVLQRLVVAVPCTTLLAVVTGSALLGLSTPQPVEPDGTLSTAALSEAHVPGPCDHHATKAFTPTAIDIDGVGHGFPVVALGRDGDVPGVPPVKASRTVALDAPGPRPGASSGLVRLNAHTWPNGGALGNQLLAKLRVGDLLTLRDGATKLCYRVTDRIDVDADATTGEAADRFYDLDGTPEVAFLVCSGERRGPGDWSKRTIWWAKPI